MVCCIKCIVLLIVVLSVLDLSYCHIRRKPARKVHHPKRPPVRRAHVKPKHKPRPPLRRLNRVQHMYHHHHHHHQHQHYHHYDPLSTIAPTPVSVTASFKNENNKMFTTPFSIKQTQDFITPPSTGKGKRTASISPVAEYKQEFTTDNQILHTTESNNIKTDTLFNNGLKPVSKLPSSKPNEQLKKYTNGQLVDIVSTTTAFEGILFLSSEESSYDKFTKNKVKEEFFIDPRILSSGQKLISKPSRE